MHCGTGCRRILELEEEMVQEMCSDVLRVKPDLVITEKGVSDLAQHYLMKAGVSVIRRLRKTDNNRIARSVVVIVVVIVVVYQLCYTKAD